MSDSTQRRLARSGEPGALFEQLRAGELTSPQLRLLAYLGDPGALEVLREVEPEAGSERLLEEPSTLFELSDWHVALAMEFPIAAGAALVAAERAGVSAHSFALAERTLWSALDVASLERRANAVEPPHRGQRRVRASAGGRGRSEGEP